MKKYYGLKITMLLLVLAVLMTGCGKKIDSTDYFEIEVQGINGYATARAKVNQPAFEKAIIEKGKLDIQTTEGAFILENYLDRIEYFVEPTENIKNGDTVTLKVYFDGDRNEKVRIIGGEKTLLVSDLPDGEEIDIFKDVKVKFAGVSPHGTAEVINKSEDEFVKEIYFEVEPSANLRVGDKVTVTANYSADAALEKKYIIASDTKEYKVEKLDSYVDKAEQITKEVKTAILKEGQDIVDSYLAQDTAAIFYELSSNVAWDDKDFRTSSKLEQVNLLLIKNPNQMGYTTTVNKLVMIYEISLTQKSTKESTDGYVALSFDNIVIGQDKKVHIVFSEGGIRERTKDKESMEQEMLASAKDKYHIETIDMKSK